MTRKIKITLLTTPNCPHCHQVKEMLQGNSTSFSEDFDLSVIDLEKAPDLVEKYQLKTAPVTIV